MTMTIFRLPALLALALAAAGVAAQSLQPPGNGDLVASRAVAATRADIANAERAPLSHYQALDRDAALAYDPTPFRAESREYWQRLSAGQLRDGYALALTAPGAVVLLSPAADAAALLREQVAILSGGERLTAAQATDTLVDATALRQAGMDVVPGSVGFRLRRGYENDAAIQVDAADGDYMLHVLEPASSQVLALQSAVDVVHADGALDVELTLDGGARIDAASGLLVAPDGSSYDLVFRQQRGSWTGRVQLPGTVPAQPGLWDVRTSVAASDGQRAFQRDARTAVAVVAPTARMDGSARHHNRRGDGALQVDIGVEVATAGRFELRGVLHGTDASGKLLPIGIAYAAAWFDPGTGALALAWPMDAVMALQAPYELRDLRLYDQSAVALLERRQLGYRID